LENHERNPETNKGSLSLPGWSLCVDAVRARLRHIAGTQWGTKRSLNIDLLKELELEQRHSMAEAI
jgi:hypothetical protein